MSGYESVERIATLKNPRSSERSFQVAKCSTGRAPARRPRQLPDESRRRGRGGGREPATVHDKEADSGPKNSSFSFSSEWRTPQQDPNHDCKENAVHRAMNQRRLAVTSATKRFFSTVSQVVGDRNGRKRENTAATSRRGHRVDRARGPPRWTGAQDILTASCGPLRSATEPIGYFQQLIVRTIRVRAREQFTFACFGNFVTGQLRAL